MAFTKLYYNDAYKRKWTSSDPDIYFGYSYEYKRDGADMLYRIHVLSETNINGASYFGYNIKVQILYGSNETIMAEKTLKGNSPSQWTDDLEWTSGWFRITNKTSGTTSIKIRVYSNSGRDAKYTYALAVAPAKSTLTVGTGDLGTNIALTVKRLSTAFTHTITAKVGDDTVTACSKSTATSISMYAPLRWLKGYSPGAKVTVTYTITTYNGSTSLGSNTVTGTVTVPDCVAYVYDGSAWKQAVCYVYDGSGWQGAKPALYNGSAWKI